MEMEIYFLLTRCEEYFEELMKDCDSGTARD